MTEPETCVVCGCVLRAYMLTDQLIDDESVVCLDCAAEIYAYTGDVRLMPAWLLVHGRELDGKRAEVLMR